jgi:hypothetical protein
MFNRPAKLIELWVLCSPSVATVGSMCSLLVSVFSSPMVSVSVLVGATLTSSTDSSVVAAFRRRMPALSMSSSRTMYRSGRLSKRQLRVASVSPASLGNTQYMISPKIPASKKLSDVLPVPGGRWDKYPRRYGIPRTEYQRAVTGCRYSLMSVMMLTFRSSSSATVTIGREERTNCRFHEPPAYIAAERTMSVVQTSLVSDQGLICFSRSLIGWMLRPVHRITMH